MTDSNYTHLLVIVDRSGSMSGLEQDMIGGINSYFAEQAKLDGKCLVDYAQFDTIYEEVFTDTPVADAKAVLVPRGGTALLDAIGKAATDLGKKLADKPEDERPGTVLVVVVTDGYENSSTEWTNAGVKALIKNQEDKYNWQFTFLGANMDAVAVGASFGFNPNTSLTYDTSNIAAASASLHAHTHRVRGGDFTGYTSEERAAQGV